MARLRAAEARIFHCPYEIREVGRIGQGKENVYGHMVFFGDNAYFCVL